MRILSASLLLLLSACANTPAPQPRTFARPLPVPVVVDRPVYPAADLTAPLPAPWPSPRMTVGDWVRSAKAYECAYAVLAYRMQAIASLDPSKPAPTVDVGNACTPLETHP